MPALPIIPDTYIVSQLTTTPGEREPALVNRFCVTLPVTGTPPLSEVAEQVAKSYHTAFGPLQSSPYNVGTTEVLPLDGVTPTNVFATSVIGAAGTGGGNPLPVALAYGITWQTGIRGRSKRGRSFIPGVDNSRVLDFKFSGLSGAAITALGNAAATFLTGLSTAVSGGVALELMVLSRKLGTVTVVSSGRPNPNLTIQRRRFERVAHS